MRPATPSPRWSALAGLLIAALPVPAPLAQASDRALLAALDGRLAAAVAAGAGAAGGERRAVQAQYDAGRDLQEALGLAEPVSRACRPLAGAAARLARLEILAAEGVDQIDAAATAAARAGIPAEAAAIVRTRRACRPAPTPRRRPVAAIDAPRPREASFGDLSSRAPARARTAELRADGRLVARLTVVRRRVRARLALPPGRHDLELRFLPASGGRPLALARSDGVWLLPRSARAAVPARRVDSRLETRLRALAGGFAGRSALWAQDLTSGRAAGWNAEARFPAASTVKIGLLVAALERLGRAPERSPLFADLEAMATRSSNLATNRLLPRLGGSEAAGAALAQLALRRLGAAGSTFPAGYLIGSELQPALPPGRVEDPPPASWRVTTARDLARALFAIQAAAVGGRRARVGTGLGRHQARVALGLLLSTVPGGDNLGLFRQRLGPSVPAAQKHGWTTSVRHSAAIVYSRGGPLIVVCLTYRPGLVDRQAVALGGGLIGLVADRRAFGVSLPRSG
ncbi:MAG: Beta-lactamase enzyme family [Miltoncostaeaceae bacterium]|jgi:beta-lactamase class A|nr:Beta-lactamase enzyme family [Miltoncostaeaceae bacterium]